MQFWQCQLQQPLAHRQTTTPTLVLVAPLCCWSGEQQGTVEQPHTAQTVSVEQRLATPSRSPATLCCGHRNPRSFRMVSFPQWLQWRCADARILGGALEIGLLSWRCLWNLKKGNEDVIFHRTYGFGSS